jgi:hypothetical protein
VVEVHLTARRAVLRCALLLGAAGVAAGCGAGAGAGGTPVQPPGGNAVFSPYADVTLASPADLAGVAPDAGARSLTLAFVTAAGACGPARGGRMAIDAPTVLDPARRLLAAGVALRVSFGGASGAELAQSCPSAAALAAAYASVIDRYHVTGADFDLEGRALTDRGAMARRGAAIAALQRRRGRPLTVSLTLPVTPEGLPASALDAVHVILHAGGRPAVINLLAMDYGTAAARGGMGAEAIRALRAAHRQLMAVGGGLSRWSALGVTVMVGVNDSPGEVLTLAEAQAVARFARERGLGLTSIWSLARDNPCGGSPAGADPTCSGVGAPPYAFSRVLGARPSATRIPRRAVDAS